MQDQQDQSQSQFSVPPTPVDNAARYGSSQGNDAVTPSDPLAQATNAVEACIARTASSPNARMREITKIRAAYIKAKFGLDVTQ